MLMLCTVLVTWQPKKVNNNTPQRVSPPFLTILLYNLCLNLGLCILCTLSNTFNLIAQLQWLRYHIPSKCIFSFGSPARLVCIISGVPNLHTTQCISGYFLSFCLSPFLSLHFLILIYCCYCIFTSKLSAFTYVLNTN